MSSVKKNNKPGDWLFRIVIVVALAVSYMVINRFMPGSDTDPDNTVSSISVETSVKGDDSASVASASVSVSNPESDTKIAKDSKSETSVETSETSKNQKTETSSEESSISAKETKASVSDSSSTSNKVSDSKTSTSGKGENSSVSEPKQTVSYRFKSKKLLNSHYEKHGIEMGFADAKSYEAAASAVINNPNALHKIEKEDGDDIYYIEDTNEFVVLSTEGYIRTYFLPSAGKKYYDKQ